MQIGEPQEINGFRITRYGYGVEVLDTTNAGKRGKSVRYWDIGTSCRGYDEASVLDAVAEVAYTVARERGDCATMDSALRLVEATVVRERTLRGIDVRPFGWQTICASTDKVAIEVRWDGFRVHDLCDHNNGTQAIPSIARKATSIARARTWAHKHHDLADALRGLTFWQVLDRMRNAGILVHTYCSVD